MKNKKLLTRIFALLASLVLVLALAIPCFADDTESSPADYNYKRVYSYEELISYLDVSYGYVPCITIEHVEFDTFALAGLSYGAENDSVFVNWFFNATDGYYQCGFDIDSTDTIIYRELFVPFDGDSSTTTHEFTWSDIELYVLLPVSTTDSSENGWYSQIKNIIKEAVFGQDAVLNDSQEFTINQISLWLTLVVVLLPLIVVAVILVRCFR